MNSQQINQIVANIQMIINNQSNQLYDYNRLTYEFRKVEFILKFWKDPNHCRRCNAYHPRTFPKCNTTCDKCNQSGHVGHICPNKTYIHNLIFACGCDPKEVKKLKTNLNRQNLLSEEERRYSMHCCNCHVPVSYKTSRPYNTQTICTNCDNMKLKRKSSQELVSKTNKVFKCNISEPIKEPEENPE